jgi:hypothetical protein
MSRLPTPPANPIPEVTPGPMASSWTTLQSEAVAIVAAAEQRGVTLRVVGSAGIRLHCDAAAPLMDELGRGAKDIDFLVPQRHRKGMRQLLEGRGYVIDRDLLIAMEGARYSFEHAETGAEIDVFVEKLEFCHTIELGARLTAHPVTIPVEELLLQKLQIIEMTTTDTIDASVLLATHQVSGSGGSEPAAGPEVIDSGYIARLLARDWGFHHTAMRNLDRVLPAAGPGRVDLGPAGNEQARRGAQRLREAAEAEPKTLSWRMRDKVGERKQWWQDVDDREATY